jgi:hypothetical protein
VTGADDRLGPERRTDRQTGGRSGGGIAFGSSSVITNARSARSAEQSTRERRYAITMAFRTGCFIAMIFVPGVFRWILFAGAVFLPYVAVIFANQSHQRDPEDAVNGGVPSDAPAVTTGDERPQLYSGDVIAGDVISGEVEEPDDRVA